MERDCEEAKTSDDSDDCAAGCERDSFGVFADDAQAAEYGGDCGVWGCLWGDCGDFWGYRRDSWMNMLAFPALALIYGLLHNVMIMKVYRKYGRDTAMMVAVASILLVIGTFVIIFRLLGEW